MIGHFATVSGEVIHALVQGVAQRAEAADGGVRRRLQLPQIVVEAGRIDSESFVRPPARQHLDIEAMIVGDRPMMAQIVDRIVGGADHFHIHLLHDATCAKLILRQQRIAALPDFIRRGRRQQRIRDAERPAQLQMRPVIERVADGVRHRGGPGVEFLAIARIAGAQPLRHAVGAHRPPFVVIAPQPDIVQVAEAGILRDLLRRQMTVIIKNRLLRRVIVIQAPGKFAVQQEIFAQKRRHLGLLTCRAARGSNHKSYHTNFY